MNISNQLKTNSGVFTLTHWDNLRTCVSETFRFSAEEDEAFARDSVAKLIAAIPFEAGCDEPERTALAHLAVYMTELRGGRKIGDHTPADNASPLARLRLLSSFKGGNEIVIAHGMNLLALVMLTGYIQSKDEDKENNIYNPLNDGSWDAPAMQEGLLEKIRANPCEALDMILPEVLAFVTKW